MHIYIDIYTYKHIYTHISFTYLSGKEIQQFLWYSLVIWYSYFKKASLRKSHESSWSVQLFFSVLPFHNMSQGRLLGWQPLRDQGSNYNSAPGNSMTGKALPSVGFCFLICNLEEGSWVDWIISKASSNSDSMTGQDKTKSQDKKFFSEIEGRGMQGVQFI